jgi:hypothetical protein
MGTQIPVTVFGKNAGFPKGKTGIKELKSE